MKNKSIKIDEEVAKALDERRNGKAYNYILRKMLKLPMVPSHKPRRKRNRFLRAFKVLFS